MSVLPPTFRPGKIDFDALMDEAERRNTYGLYGVCEEQHMLCPNCGVCMKYCHDDYECHPPGYPSQLLAARRGR